MNLKIKCDTPKEQVLVLRKFKKLVPEVNWNGGVPLEDFMPFVDNNEIAIHLFLHNLGYVTYNDVYKSNDPDFHEFTASDFLRDDWKLEDDKDENESLRLGLQKIRENFNKSLNELEESLRVKKEQ